MREIKFRAWHAQNKKMLGPWSIWKSNLVECSDTCFLEIMQYTGLKDKNGKEIYDGDIINYGLFALNDTEKYGDECWENLPDGIDQDDISTIKSTHKVDYSIPSLMAILQAIENNPDVAGVEIIGNIYENPELLEK